MSVYRPYAVFMNDQHNEIYSSSDEIYSSDESTDSANSPHSPSIQWNSIASTAARVRLNSQGNEIDDSESESSEECENEEEKRISVYGWNRGMWYDDLYGDIADSSSDEDIYESSSDEDIVYDDEIEYVDIPVVEISRNEYDNLPMEIDYGDNEYDGDDEEDARPLVSDRDPFLSDAMVPHDDEIDLLFGNQTGLWLYNNAGARMNQIASDILNGDDIEMQELP